MERKYYLRGLGLGIAVTAVIMGFALSNNRAMTDSEIIARAKELGMVENTVLANTSGEEESQDNTESTGSDGQEQTVDKGQDIAQAGQDELRNPPAVDHETEGNAVTDPETEGDTDAGGANAGVSPDAVEADTVPDLNAEEEEADSVPDDEESGESEEANTVITPGTVRVITINSGDSSYTVAKKLADVGVVTSASTFDTFLCENGYDKRIRTGTFSIPADASDEQIARIVSGLE